LAGLEDEAGPGVIFELVRCATEAEGFGDDFVEVEHRGMCHVDS
jgi:hypothetical protein